MDHQHTYGEQTEKKYVKKIENWNDTRKSGRRYLK